jgi:hypothetical protein
MELTFFVEIFRGVNVRRRRGVEKLATDLRFVPCPDTVVSVAGGGMEGAFTCFIDKAGRLGTRWACFTGV